MSEEIGIRLPSLVRTVCAVIMAGNFALSVANQPPTVDAGENDTVPTGKNVSFVPQVDDDSTPAVDLITRWRQISGPGSSEILDSTAPFSMVSFTQTGVYVFLLTATDGQGLTASDSVVFQVREPVPFQVLAPVNRQAIVKDVPFTILWQNEGSTACRVYVSYDDGLTETMISTRATYDSLVYTFTEPAGTEGTILLRYYPGAGPADVVVSGTFVIVDSLQGSADPWTRRPAAPSRPLSRLSVAGMRHDATSGTYSLCGRNLAGKVFRSSGVLVNVPRK